MAVTPETLAGNGWDVAPIGRRIGARCLDGAISIGLTVAIYAALVIGSVNGSSGLLVLALLLLVAYGVIALWLLLAKAATLGQLVLGMQNLDVATGRPSGGKALLKYFAMGLSSQFTAGLALLLALFFREQPLNRTWFDRIAGTVVGLRTGILTATSAPATPHAGWPVRPPVRVEVRPTGPPPPPRLRPTPTVEQSAAPPPWALPPVSGAAYDPPPGPVPVTVDAGVPSLVLDHGATLRLDRNYVLGRDPSTPPGADQAQPVTVVDPERSLSKTHVLVEADAGGVWVTDLHSTNGVSVADPSGIVTNAVPGTRTRVPVGGTITYGNRTMRVSP